MFHARVAAVSIICAAMATSPVAAEEKDWSKELEGDIVRVSGGKMNWTEYGFLTLHRQADRRLQVKWTVEAPARGLVSRDKFVALGTTLQTVLLISIASGGKRFEMEDLSELYTYVDLDEPIGKVDVTIAIIVAKNGLQVSVEGAQSRRFTMTWAEALGPKAVRSEAASGDLPPMCEKFLRTYAACVDEMPERARGPASDGLRQMRASWDSAPRAGMASACAQAWDAAKGSMGAACPNVLWR